MIHRRIGGLVRDAWYLVAVMVTSIVLLWIFIAPAAAVIAILCCVATFGYFGIVRYDDDGNERTDDRA